jgi:hypothetical protein
MAITRRIISVSVDDLDYEFIKDNHLSPTRLLRAKCQEMRDNDRVEPETLKEANRKLQAWRELFDTAKGFIERNGKEAEFTELLLKK